MHIHILYTYITKTDANKKKQKLLILSPKDIYGFYQDDTVSVGYK